MKVIIVEDNNIHRQRIKDLLIGIQIKLNIEFDIILSNDTTEILKQNSNYSDIINIIDIIDDNDETFNGVDLAACIKSITRSPYIIFMTSYDDYLANAVNNNVEPLAYINKTNPNIERILLNTFRKILYTKEHFDNNIRLEFTDENSDTIFLSLQDIFLIHSCPEKQKYICVETIDKSYQVRGKITDYDTKHTNLIRCNKSTVINKLKISKITKGTNSKNKKIYFDTKDGRDLPPCLLSSKYKSNLI